jgi:cytochrome P450
VSRYADVLREEDVRIGELFDVEAETLHAGATLIDDPFPAINRLREAAPVHKGALGELIGYSMEAGQTFQFHKPNHLTYSAFSFNAVSRALIDNKTFSSRAYYIFDTVENLGETILNKGGLDHRRIRDPIQPLFSPDSAQDWWSRKIIDETVDTLISVIEKKGRADLFLELCARMPVHVVSAGFGFDPGEIIPFRMALMETSRHSASAEERAAASRKTSEMLTRLIEARRKKAENDIISGLVQAEIALDDGSTRPFTNEEIIDNCRLIVVAGGGTTWRQLGITLFALLNNQDQFEILKADRSLIPRVILESARWHATDLVFPRLVEEDVNLEGVDIPKGAILHMCLGSANRDPSRWENPDKFDIQRPLQRALAFGGGAHSCLGQHVSRQEMDTALNAIMDRLPDVRWDDSKPAAKLVGGLFQRGPSALPVVFG